MKSRFTYLTLLFFSVIIADLAFASSSVKASSQVSLEKMILEMGVKFTFPERGVSPKILEKGERNQLGDNKMQLMFKFNSSLEKVLNDIMEEQGHVDVDCQLFAQVGALLIEGKAQDEEFFLLKGAFHPHFFGVFYEQDMGYLAPSDKEVGIFIQENGLWFNNKGNWIVKDGKKWAGITKEGPVFLTQSEWAIKTKNDLESEVDQVLTESIPVPNFEMMAANIIKIYLKMGRLNEWTLFESK